MAEKQDATNAAVADGGGAGASGGFADDVRRWGDGMREDIRGMKKDQWKLLAFSVFGVPVVVELVSMFLDMFRP